jgi:hypothetical protein
MEIVNGFIVDFDKNDKNLVIPKNAVGADYAVYNLMCVEGFDSITVEEDNEHFYMQDGCLIWRDKKALMLAVKGAKIPADGSVTQIAGGAFMYREELEEIEIPACIKAIRYSAFAYTSLKKVTLNEGLQVLDSYAFGFIDTLKELAIPKSVKKIDKYDILENSPFMTECGYKNKVYHVYKNSRAYVWAKRNKMQYKIREK